MFHYSQGDHPKQAHKGIKSGIFEEEQGRKGFFGNVSHLYKQKPSTRWTKIEGPLKPRMYDLVETGHGQKGPQRLLYNADIEISMEVKEVEAAKEIGAYRNADGDMIYFCHEGEGKILTDYGLLKYRKSDYIVMPKCVPHVFLPEKQSQFLEILNLSGSGFWEPDRGILGKNALYDTEQFNPPNLAEQNDLLKQDGLKVLRVHTRHEAEETIFHYDECIFDTVGWKGDLFPFTLNMDQIMPLLSHRYHLPPSAHSTFVAQNFVVCSFLPRPVEEEKDVLKVPFYHQNIDYDEVLFYHNGDFFSRSNLHPGMMSFHPAGFPHGPHPKAVDTIEDKTHHNECAVMIDTRRPLKRDSFMENVEVADYWQSWQK